jgi:hypothetical protein
MKIDFKKSEIILKKENEIKNNENIIKKWREHFLHLENLIDKSGLTMWAALGTAILAKATHIEVDAYALKVNVSPENKYAYSARSLCTNVLAALAPELNIDLGVTGREPFNNQPFFGKPRLDSKELIDKLHPRSKVAYPYFLDLIENLNSIQNPDDARAILRTFLYVRQKKSHTWSQQNGQFKTLQDLIEHAKKFALKDSEHGKRAQAIVAGLCDISVGQDRVQVSKIHDPDRRFPGDVIILNSNKNVQSIERSFEVRDKPVKVTDIISSLQKIDNLNKTKKFFLERLVVVGINKNQDKEIDIKRAKLWGEKISIKLKFYSDWETLFEDMLFLGPTISAAELDALFNAIGKRLVQMEVSESGLLQWSTICIPESDTPAP